jgi:hypothetical protein
MKPYPEISSATDDCGLDEIFFALSQPSSDWLGARPEQQLPPMRITGLERSQRWRSPPLLDFGLPLLAFLRLLERGKHRKDSGKVVDRSQSSFRERLALFRARTGVEMPNKVPRYSFASYWIAGHRNHVPPLSATITLAYHQTRSSSILDACPNAICEVSDRGDKLKLPLQLVTEPAH